MTDCNLVFDIGGTHLRAAASCPMHGTILRSEHRTTPSFETRPAASADELLVLIVEAMAAAADNLEVGVPAVIGVAFAGPVDSQGMILAAPTIVGRPLDAPYDFSALVKHRWPDANVFIVNDVTAAGYRFVEGPTDEFCIVTVSSGIGGKVFLKGRPLRGSSGRGGEFGHWQVDGSIEAIRCDCGGFGHLGALASGRGVIRIYRIRKGYNALTIYDLVHAFHAGERDATEVVRTASGHLGRTLALLHLSIGIERFIIYGGLTAALGDPYRRLLAEAIAASCWDGKENWMDRVQIVVDDDLGLVGLGRLIAEQRLSIDGSDPSL